MPEPGTVILVDGYNVLRSSGRYDALLSQTSDHTHQTYNTAREALINDVASFAGTSCQATIVFDAANNPESLGEPSQVGGIKLIFSASGQTADAVIEELSLAAREAGNKVLVITSDADTQWTVLGGQVARMSAVGFATELSELVSEHNADKPFNTVKTTLGDRLDAKTKERLQTLYREKR